MSAKGWAEALGLGLLSAVFSPMLEGVGQVEPEEPEEPENIEPEGVGDDVPAPAVDDVPAPEVKDFGAFVVVRDGERGLIASKAGDVWFAGAVEDCAAWLIEHTGE